MNSFRAFFYILDYCYGLCQEYDLGGVLGAISPELWDDGKPMDMGIYHDWENHCKGEVIDSTNLIEKIREFLVLYEKRYGFNFTQTEELLTNKINNDVIKKAIEYAKY